MGNSDVEPTEELDSIEEIIEDELQRAKVAEPIKLSEEAARQSDAAHQISKAIYELIEAEPIPYFFRSSDIDTLYRLIKRARLSNGFAHSTFQYVEMKLKDALAKHEEDSELFRNITDALDSLNFAAVRYFEQDLFEELKGVHIAEILQRSKATLARLDIWDQKYFRQAVESVKADVERRIELRKEEKLNRDQMYEPEAEREEDFDLNKESKVDDRMKRQKDRGLTRENAYLFIEYLFEYAIRDTTVKASIKDRAEVAEFLTGYSSTKLKDVPAWFKAELAKIKESEETGEKIFSELQMIRKQFETLGLQEIVDKIDRDLGEDS